MATFGPEGPDRCSGLPTLQRPITAFVGRLPIVRGKTFTVAIFGQCGAG